MRPYNMLEAILGNGLTQFTYPIDNGVTEHHCETALLRCEMTTLSELRL